jgi:hypothetical protein
MSAAIIACTVSTLVGFITGLLAGLHKEGRAS